MIVRFNLSHLKWNVYLSIQSNEKGGHAVMNNMKKMQPKPRPISAIGHWNNLNKLMIITLIFARMTHGGRMNDLRKIKLIQNELFKKKIRHAK